MRQAIKINAQRLEKPDKEKSKLDLEMFVCCCKKKPNGRPTTTKKH